MTVEEVADLFDAGNENSTSLDRRIKRWQKAGRQRLFGLDVLPWAAFDGGFLPHHWLQDDRFAEKVNQWQRESIEYPTPGPVPGTTAALFPKTLEALSKLALPKEPSKDVETFLNEHGVTPWQAPDKLSAERQILMNQE